MGKKSKVRRSGKFRPTIFLLVFAVAGLLFTGISRAATIKTPPPLSGYVYASKYYRNAPVRFGAQNKSTQTVYIPVTPWKITNMSGVTVYSPASIAIVEPLGPFMNKEWTWNQKDNYGKQVPAGMYRIVINGSPVLTVTLDATSPSSSGYFTFGIGPSKVYGLQKFRVRMTNATAIKDANDNYYGRNNKFPNGTLVDARPNKSPYDSQWSWYLNPSSVTMTDTSIEICDGRPTDIENNMDYWVRTVRSYCPWGARVVGLQ